MIEVPTNERDADLEIMKRKHVDVNRRGLFKVPLQDLPRESEKPRKDISHETMSPDTNSIVLSASVGVQDFHIRELVQQTGFFVREVACSKRDVHKYIGRK
jgi:hypothetical protein